MSRRIRSLHIQTIAADRFTTNNYFVNSGIEDSNNKYESVSLLFLIVKISHLFGKKQISKTTISIGLTLNIFEM